MSIARSTLTFARIFVGAVALSGYLLGQVFFGAFSLPSTLVGVSALTAVFISRETIASRFSNIRLPLLSCSAFAFVGMGLEAYDYYANQSFPGNDFAWEIKMPFIGAQLYIALLTRKPSNSLYQGANDV